MGLIADLTAADKNGLFSSDDYYTMHPTGILPLDYANGFWQQKEMKDGSIKMVPMVGLMGGTFTGIIATTGSGKAQPDNTMVLGEHGWVRLGDLQIGDKVYTRKGTLANVSGIFPRGNLEAYQLTLETFQTTPCSKDHLWTVYDEDGNEFTITLIAIMDSMATGKKYYLPCNNEITFDSDYGKLDASVMGLILGGLRINKDGSWKIVSKTDEYPRIIAENMGWEFKEGQVEDGYISYTFTKKGKLIVAQLDPTGKLIVNDEFFQVLNKGLHIPSVYKMGKSILRWNFLRGFLTSAHDSFKSGNTIGYTLTSPRLAGDLAILARSLGIKTTYNPINNNQKIKLELTDYQYWYLFATHNDKEKIPTELADRIQITEIKSLGYSTPMRCIYVDDPEHLYITEDFIVTHNTTLADQIGYNMIRPYKDGLLIHVDAEKTSNKQRILQITNAIEGEKRIILNKQHTSIEDVMTMVNEICDMKESAGRAGMVKMPSPFKEDEFFWAYPPTVFIIDSLPAFNSKNYNVEDLGSNADGMIAARDTTRFYTNCLDRAWHYNLNFIVINHIKPKVEVNPYAKAPNGLLLLGTGEHLPRGTVAQYYSQTYFRIKMMKSDPYTISDNGFDGFRCVLELSKSKTNSIGTDIPLAFNNAKGFDQIYTLYEFAKSCGLVKGKNPHLFFDGMEDMKFSRKDFRKKFIGEDIFRVKFMEALRPVLEMLLAKKPTVYEVGVESPEMLDFAYGGIGMQEIA